MAGVLFELVDWKIPVEELARILLHLSKDERTYQCLKSTVNNVVTKFDIAYTARQYIDIYKDALRK